MSEITLNSLPKTLDELKAMPQAALTVPEEVAALTVAALALYPENPAETEKMLDFLRGPRPLNGIDKQFNITVTSTIIGAISTIAALFIAIFK